MALSSGRTFRLAAVIALLLMLTLMAGCLQADTAETAETVNTVQTTATPAAQPERIAFVRAGNIWLMNSDGTSETQLTDSYNCAHPSWSPDGDRLTFERDRNICVLDLSTRNVVTLTTSGDCHQPAWRPGSNEVWYVRLTGGNDDSFSGAAVWRIGADGKSVKKLIDLVRQVGDVEFTGTWSSTWRPDGKQIAVQLQTVGEGFGPIVFDAQGKLVEDWGMWETDPKWGLWGTAGISWCPTDPNRLAAAILYRAETLEPKFAAALATVDLTSNTEKRLYDAPHPDWEDTALPVMLDGTTWSPDGSQIAFCVWPSWEHEGEGSSDLWMVAADGSNVRWVAGQVEDPAWSRCVAGAMDSGKKSADVPGRVALEMDGQVFVQHKLGGFAPVHAGTDPAWSPDGTQVAFLETEDAEGPDSHGIFVVGADGSGVRRLAKVAGIVDGGLSWSPDGKLIAAGSVRRGTWKPTISIIDVATGNVSVLPVGGTHVTWSPDGTKLAYVARSDNGASIKLCTAAGEPLNSISLPAGDEDDGPAIDTPLRWSPDGTSLAYIRAAEIRLLELATGTEQTLAGPEVDGGKSFAGLDWTRDGSRIVFAVTLWASEITAEYAICSMEADGSDLQQHRTLFGYMRTLTVR